MGALTDLADKADNRDGYLYAKKICRKYGNDVSDLKKVLHELEPTMSERRLENLIFDVEVWYERFCKREIQKYFILYEWHFKEHPKNIQVLKEVVKKCPYLDGYERMSKDTDFFMFRPIKPSLGFELQNIGVLTPYELNKYLYGVVIDRYPNDPEYIKRRHFEFSW